MTEGSDEYGDYSVDEDNQPGVEDNLDDDLEDPLDRGYSPPERYSNDYGNTPWEEEHRETIDQRIQQEVPEPDPYADGGPVDEDDSTREVGEERAGRLVEPDEGAREDQEKDLLAEDVGIDGAAASAEEAAVHIIDDDEL
jgi:hypothetical protein